MINSKVFIYLLYRVLINNTTQCSIWTIRAQCWINWFSKLTSK